MIILTTLAGCESAITTTTSSSFRSRHLQRRIRCFTGAGGGGEEGRGTAGGWWRLRGRRGCTRLGGGGEGAGGGTGTDDFVLA